MTDMLDRWLDDALGLVSWTADFCRAFSVDLVVRREVIDPEHVRVTITRRRAARPDVGAYVGILSTMPVDDAIGLGAVPAGYRGTIARVISLRLVERDDESVERHHLVHTAAEPSQWLVACLAGDRCFALWRDRETERHHARIAR